MKKPNWYTTWRRNPHSTYVHWAAFFLVAVCASFSVALLTVPKAGNAKGQTSLLVSAGGYNVTPLGKVKEVPPLKEKGQTLEEQCQAKTAKANWGACCSPPDYATSDACENLKNKGQAPPTDQQNEDQIPQNQLKLLPANLQSEYSQLMQRGQQIQAQANQLTADAQQAVACENACPCGAGACGDVDQATGSAHDQCITSCDAALPQLMSRAGQLKQNAANLTKSADALKSKVEAYKAKNKKKFRSIDGARH